MIAILIFYSGKLIIKNEIDINNFFLFSCYDACLSTCKILATVNMSISQGLSAASRILPIIDNKNEIKDKSDATELKINNANVKFKDVF